MKKITLLLIASLFCLCSYAQLAQENFDGTWTPNQGPPGWKILQNGIGTTITWDINDASNSLTPSYQGLHAAYLQRENVTNGLLAEDYLVTPEFTLPSNAQLTFYSRLTQVLDQGGIYKIKFLPQGADANDISNYIDIQTWTELQLNPSQTDYTQKIVSIPGTVGTTVRLAFVMAGDDADRWLIDNVKVASLCANPTSLTATNIGLTSANLSWANPSNATSWKIEILEQSQTATGAGINYTGSLPYPAIGLASNTAYKYYVQALCSDGGNSAWIGPFNFTTPNPGSTCAFPFSVTLPYFKSGNTSTSSDLIEGTVGGAGCGLASGSQFNGNDVVFAYTATFTGNISINFNTVGQASALMMIYNSCATIGVSCAGGGLGGSLGVVSVPSFAVTTGQTYYFVVSTTIGVQYTPYSLAIQQVTCTPPVGNAATNITANSANLSWSNPTAATSWQVKAQPAGTGVPAGAGTTVTLPSFTATGLNLATNYEYYVRSDCGNGTFSAWAGPYLFSTPVCGTNNQCTYNFVLTDSAANGWNGNTMTISQNGIPVATIGSTFTTGAGPVTIPVALCDGIPFTLYWNNAGSNAAQCGISIVNSFSQTIYNKPFNTGAANSLLYTGSTNCTVPVCFPPTALTATGITQTSANLGWAGNATGSWEYKVVAAGSAAPDAAATGTATTTNPALATGLTTGTNYQYYVREYCTPTNKSSWAGPFAFSTAICPASSQCNYTFTMTSQVLNGYSGNTMTITQNGINVAVIGSGFTTGGSASVTVPLCDNLPFQVFWNSGGNAAYAPELGLKVINSFGQTLYQKLPGVGSQNSLLYTGTNDCDTAACLAPTNLAATNIGTSTAQLSWTDVSFASSWEIAVQPEGTLAPTGSGTTVNTTATYLATGLTPGTPYQYYVRAHCGGTTFSPWAGPFKFSTSLCEPANRCTYTFQMTDAFCDGWNGGSMTVTQNGSTVVTLGPSYLDTDGCGPIEVTADFCTGIPIEVFWNIGGDYNEEMGLSMINSFGQVVFEKPQGTGEAGTVVYSGIADCINPICFPPTSLTATVLSSSAANLSWANAQFATGYQVYIVPVAGAAPTSSTTGTATATNTYSATGLLANTAYKYYVKNTCSSSNISTWAGPFNFTTLPTCLQPVNIAASNITGISAKLTWTPAGGATSWEVYIVPSVNPAPDTATAGTPVTTALYQATGLSVNTTYSFYVRSICSSTNVSPWTGPYNFTTLIATCLQPTSQTAAILSTSQAQLNWTEADQATQWEIYIGNTTPIATTTGTLTTTKPYTVSGLSGGTTYQFYVRAICTPTDHSFWTGPYSFTTAVINDDCSGAFVLSVNPGQDCTTVTPAVFTISTPSGEGGNCNTTVGADVWFQFTALQSAHRIAFDNFQGAPQPIEMVLYEGAGCGALVQLKCTNNNVINATGLQPGAIYKIRAILDLANPNLNTAFKVCVSTPPPPANNNQNECIITTINYDFESPQPATASFFPAMINHNTVQGWKTTATDQIMEFWHVPNYESRPAYSGNQFIELNAFLVSGVYQDYATPLETIFSYGFAHRGRSGTDTCQLLAGPPGGPYTVVQQVSTGNTAWSYNTGSYTVPVGQLVTRFIFQSVSSAGNDPTVGNFLDAITFTANNGILSPNPMAMSCQDTVANVQAAGIGVWTAHTDNPAVTVINNSTTTTPSISGFSVAGAYRYDWSTNYCVSTLVINYNPETIVPPTADATIVYCLNDTALAPTATALSGNILKWYDTPNGGTSTAIPAIPDTSLPGVKMYYVSQSLNNCESARTAITVTVNDLPPLPATSAVTYCQGAIAQPLEAAAITGNTLKWYTVSTGGSALSAAPTPDTSQVGTTSYYVSQTGVNSCESASNQIIVTITQPVPAVTGFTLPLQVCIAAGNPVPETQSGFTLGGIFSSVSGLTINPVTGEIDLEASIPGTYDVTYAVTNDTDNCIAAGASHAEITITPLTAAITDFSYTSPVCTGSANLFPTVAGGFNAGGTYSGTDGLVIDPVTGEVNITTTPAGIYTITYTVVEDTANCISNGTSVTTLTITPLGVPTLGFAYNSPVCQGTPNQMPTTVSGFITGGTYSATAGLAIDPVTGEVNLSSSAAGTYTVSYSTADTIDQCLAGATSQTTFTVTAPVQPIFGISYPDTLCSWSGPQLPELGNGFITGGTFSASSGLVIDALSGEISPDTAGIYTVTYELEANQLNCTASTSVSAIVTIVAPATPVADFSYTSPVCATAGLLVPFTATGFVSGGTYTSQAGLLIDPLTGAIDTAASLPGNYTVTYTIEHDHGNCIDGASGQATIIIVTANSSNAVFAYEENYCFGTKIIMPVLSADFTSGGEFTSSGGLKIDPSTGTIDSSLAIPGTYTVTYTVAPNPANCQQGASFSQNIILHDEIILAFEGNCQDNAFIITASVSGISGDENLTYEWVNTDGVNVGSDSTTFNVSDYMARTGVTETLPLDFVLTVSGNGCEASGIYTVQSISCTIQRGISPNGDNMNDSFELSDMDVRKIEVFNRYGQEVYSLGNYTNQWHGQSKNGEDLPTGTYFYMIELSNGSSKTGWIYLNRQD